MSCFAELGYYGKIQNLEATLNAHSRYSQDIVVFMNHCDQPQTGGHSWLNGACPFRRIKMWLYLHGIQMSSMLRRSGVPLRVENLISAARTILIFIIWLTTFHLPKIICCSHNIINPKLYILSKFLFGVPLILLLLTWRPIIYFLWLSLAHTYV
jgi:hypothetical protein